MQQKTGTEWWGEYRARVVEVDIEKGDFGAIRVFVPDIFYKKAIKKAQKSFDEYKNGLIAYPANNAMGGYNKEDKDKTSYYQGSMHVPLKNSYVWVRFEGGDLSRPFYTGAFMYRNSKVLPECRGIQYPHKSYVLCKTNAGRKIVVCDSPDQARIELSGASSLLSGESPGNSESVYKIKDNMNSFLLDERDGKAKFLMKSSKGDYIHFDIDQQGLQAFFEKNVNFKNNGDVDISIKGNVTIKVDGDIVLETGGDQSTKNGGSNVLETGQMICSKSGWLTAIDSGGTVSIQLPFNATAEKANPVAPKGERST